MLNLPEKIIIYDTEYTTWEGAQARNWSGPNEFREIVQIGVFRVNMENLETEEEKLIFIRPKKNPILSEFFIELTGISQEDVDTSGTIVRAFGKPITRRPHHALNDVKTIVDGLRLMAESLNPNF